MSEEKGSRPPNQRKGAKRTEKYVLPRNRKTEHDVLNIFEYGTEAEFTQYMRENGLTEGNPRFTQLLKLFREHAERRR
jgi:hypothetical protein